MSSQVAALDLPLLQLCETKGYPAITLAQEDGLIAHTDYFRQVEGANHRGEESLFLMGEPITGGKRAYS
eukprot:8133322-Pyramimonas_sp.AAC.1